MKSDYRMRAEKFIDKWFDYVNTHAAKWTDIDDIARCVEDFNADYHRNLILRTGVVRMVVVISDYVVKWDYSTEDCIDFYGGCERELQFWKFVEGDGYLEKYFAPITKYTRGDMNFYIMPRATSIGYCGCIEDNINANTMIDLLNYVDDLHSGNFGKIHGEIKIVDYACHYLPR